MRGLITAGGLGTRMGLSTKATNKHLLPVYDVPMIMNSLRYLLRAGLQDVLIVSNPHQLWHFGEVLGDVSALEAEFGHSVRIHYKKQENPTGGIGEVIKLAEEFCTIRDKRGQVIGKDDITVVLGDNVFKDSDLLVDAAKGFNGGAVVFAKVIPEALLFQGNDEQGYTSRFGMISRKGDIVVKIEEKPRATKGPDGKLRLSPEFENHEVLVGAYIFDSTCFDRIKTMKPSLRGQLEVTAIMQSYLDQGQLRVSSVQGWWSDCGNPDTLLLASMLQYHMKGMSLDALYERVQEILKE
ncbi:NTP transferase domain-containing protein [Candidatus Woesearchaeota archaeon]|nr:NTP transferase domain-containing protein [Candidatus Woesearchaeota archaeon]